MLNARPAGALDEWLVRIKDGLDAAKHLDPAPFAVNLIVHDTNERLSRDLETCVRHEVPILIRRIFGGPIALAGAITSGHGILAAEALGADFAYIGTRFIATQEANAAAEYKQMIVDCAAADIVYTDAVSGIHGNYLGPSLQAAGIDPSKLSERSGQGNLCGP